MIPDLGVEVNSVNGFPNENYIPATAIKSSPITDILIEVFHKREELVGRGNLRLVYPVLTKTFLVI